MNTCPRCGYTTDYMSNFKKHLKTKTMCAPIVSDDDLTTLSNTLFVTKDKPFTCSKCSKCFSSKKGHLGHERVCTKEPVNEPLEQTTLTTSICPQPSLIKKNCFGYENIDYISDSTLYELSQQSTDGALKLIDLIYFNDEHPENQNVWMRTLKNVYVYRSKGWLIENVMMATTAMCTTAIVILKNCVFKRYDPNHSNLEDMCFSILYLRPHKYACIRQGIQTKLLSHKHRNKYMENDTF